MKSPKNRHMWGSPLKFIHSQEGGRVTNEKINIRESTKVSLVIGIVILLLYFSNRGLERRKSGRYRCDP